MEEKTTRKEKSQKKTAAKSGGLKRILTNLKVEFGRIIWPDKDSLIKQTIAVVLISIALCLVITVLDTVISTGIGFLMK